MSSKVNGRTNSRIRCVNRMERWCQYQVTGLDYFQPIDLTVNKNYIDFLRQQTQSWYSNEIVDQMQKGKKPHEIKVDVRISIMKPLNAKWIAKCYGRIRSKPDLIINGWRKSGITENPESSIHSSDVIFHRFCILLKLRKC